jgi:SAM-dependent methyltransferase
MNDAERAYDTAAPRYDALAATASRERLHATYRGVVRPGDRVLDAGCGTGIDTAFLAGLGARVVGVDASEGMLAVARERTYAGPHPPTFLRGDLARLDEIVDGPFDAMVSGFAALNTVADLSRFARAAHRRLEPGGRLVVHVLVPGGLYDRLGDASRGRLRRALSGWDERTQVVRIADVPVTHRLLHPRLLVARHFRPWFELVDLQQVGAFIPDDGPSRVPPRVVSALVRLDGRAARWPWVRAHGRFAILTLRAAPGQGGGTT